MRLLLVLIFFLSFEAFAQETIPIPYSGFHCRGYGFVKADDSSRSIKDLGTYSFPDTSQGRSAAMDACEDSNGFTFGPLIGNYGDYRRFGNGGIQTVFEGSVSWFEISLSGGFSCPPSHPIENNDGTCSEPPPEMPEDCPIGTKLSIGLGQLGDGSPPVCEPFSCPVGGANVTIPTQFFEVDFGSPSFAFCDGSCAYTVSTGSGGSVNAYASGLACGNGTAEYVYAAPTFDSEYCDGGDNWVDCSADPDKVDEANPITSYDPVTPEDIGAPLEEEPDFTPEPLPDCTAETALSGGCFVNSMDAVQTNISGSISTSQSQQTDRVVKSITALINSNREGMTGLGDKLAKTIEESRRASALPFLTQQFAGTENLEPVAMTVQEAATGLDFDADGWNFSSLIPTATKTLGWNPSDYQFGVGGGLCPEPTVLVIGGQNISLDWSMFCDMAVIINAFLIAMAYFIGGNIIMRAF